MAQVAPMPVMVPAIAPSYAAAESAHAPAIGMMPTSTVASAISSPDVSLQQQMNAAKQKPRETVEVVEAGNAPVVAQRRGILIPEGRTSFLAQVFAQSKAAERVQDAGYNLQVSMLSQVTGTLEKTTPINFRDLLGWRRELLHYNAPPYEEKTAISADEESIFSGAVLREPVTVTQQLRYATGSYQASSSLIEKV